VWSALPVLLHDCGSQGIGFATEVGEGAGRGYNVNVPWFETKMGDGDYMAGECSRDPPSQRSGFKAGSLVAQRKD
jgi:hypothetical protein